MPFYKVHYSSMTANYGPSIVEAENEYSARRKFAGTAFSSSEMGLIEVREISSEEISKALKQTIK